MLVKRFCEVIRSFRELGGSPKLMGRDANNMHSGIGSGAEGAFEVVRVLIQQLPVLQEELSKPVFAIGIDSRELRRGFKFGAAIFEANLHGMMPILALCRITDQRDALWLAGYLNFESLMSDGSRAHGFRWLPIEPAHGKPGGSEKRNQETSGRSQSEQ